MLIHPLTSNTNRKKQYFYARFLWRFYLPMEAMGILVSQLW